MVSVELRRTVPDAGLAALRTEYNRWADAMLGNAGGRLWLVGDDDGTQKNIAGGAVLATGTYRAQVRSGGGNHLAVPLSTTAAKATPTTSNSVLLVQDAALSIGQGKALRIYETGGVDYAEMTSSNGALALGGSGASAGSLTGLTSLSLSGDLTFTGTGKRIFGDFSNATDANRVSIQSSTVNGNTILNAIPNGTSAISGFNCYAGSNPAASAYLQFLTTSTLVRIYSGHNGAAYLPLVFYNNGVEQMRIAANGDITIAPAAGKIAFYGGTPAAKPAALTQNYSTADRTLSAYTSDPESVGYTGLATGLGGIPYASVADLNLLRGAYENLRVFVEDLAAFHNSHVDDHQLMGLV